MQKRKKNMIQCESTLSLLRELTLSVVEVVNNPNMEQGALIEGNREMQEVLVNRINGVDSKDSGGSIKRILEAATHLDHFMSNKLGKSRERRKCAKRGNHMSRIISNNNSKVKEVGIIITVIVKAMNIMNSKVLLKISLRIYSEDSKSSLNSNSRIVNTNRILEADKEGAHLMTFSSQVAIRMLNQDHK